MKKINLLDVYTEEEIREIAALDYTDRAVTIKNHYLDRFNEFTQQENDPGYIGYMCEYWVMMTDKE